MKLIIAIFCFCSIFQAKAQLNTFDLNYVNAETNNYKLNEMVSFSSLEGKYRKAKTMISKQQYANNLNFELSETLLLYNVYGKAKAFTFLDSIAKVKKMPNNTVLYAKGWVSLLSNNYDDYKNFDKQISPSSVYKLKLDIKSYFKYNSRYKLEDDYVVINQNFINRIDVFLLKTKGTDYVTLSLIKCDLLSRIEDRDDEIVSILTNLLDQYSRQINNKVLSERVEEASYNSSKFKQIKKRLEKAIDLEKSNINRVFDIIEDFYEKGTSLKKGKLQVNNSLKSEQLAQRLESKLEPLLKNEPSTLEREKIKALIRFKTQNIETVNEFGLFNITMSLNYSEGFKTLLKTTSTKTQVLDRIKLLLETETFNKVNGIVEAKDIELLKEGTLNEIILLEGVLLYYYVSFKPAAESFNASIRVNLNRDDIKDLESYESFFEDNPLYYDSGVFTFNSYKKTITKEDLNNALGVLNRLQLKYPGSVSFAKTKLSIISETINFDVPVRDYIKDMFSALIDLYVLNQSEGVELVKGNEFEDYFYDYISKKDLYISRTNTLFEKLLSELNKEDFKALLESLETAIKRKPNNNNLKNLNLRLLEFEDDKQHYINTYFEYLKYDLDHKHFDTSSLENFERNEIKSILKSNFNSALNGKSTDMSELYDNYGLKEESFKILSKNFKLWSNYYKFSKFFELKDYIIEELLNNTNFINKGLEYSKIIKEDNPNHEGSYLLLSAFQLLNDNTNESFETLDSMKSKVNIKLDFDAETISALIDVIKQKEINTSILKKYRNKIGEIYPKEKKDIKF